MINTTERLNVRSSHPRFQPTAFMLPALPCFLFLLFRLVIIFSTIASIIVVIIILVDTKKNKKTSTVKSCLYSVEQILCCDTLYGACHHRGQDYVPPHASHRVVLARVLAPHHSRKQVKIIKQWKKSHNVLYPVHEDLFALHNGLDASLKGYLHYMRNYLYHFVFHYTKDYMH